MPSSFLCAPGAPKSAKDSKQSYSSTNCYEVVNEKDESLLIYPSWGALALSPTPQKLTTLSKCQVICIRIFPGQGIFKEAHYSAMSGTLADRAVSFLWEVEWTMFSLT